MAPGNDGPAAPPPEPEPPDVPAEGGVPCADPAWQPQPPQHIIGGYTTTAYGAPGTGAGVTVGVAGVGPPVAGLPPVKAPD